MVTASELNQLNVWNDKIEESTSCPESYIPDSISWNCGILKTNYTKSGKTGFNPKYTTTDKIYDREFFNHSFLFCLCVLQY